MERLTKLDGIGQNEIIKCFGCDLEKAGSELEHCGYCVAWDHMRESAAVFQGLELYANHAVRRPHGSYATVYVLTNYDTSLGDDLHRIYTLRDMGYDPYVMIYDKPNAPQEIRYLQRWCNNRLIFRSEPDFKKYNPRRG